MNYGRKDRAVRDATASERTGRRVAMPPLCLDLDGSLLDIDTLVEALTRTFHNWLALRRLPPLFESARLKAGLTDLVNVDPGGLPFNEAALK